MPKLEPLRIDPEIEFSENCEQCGHLMPEDCIGWCAECDTEIKEEAGDPWEDFYEWGGWRRAFGEYTDEEWEAVKGTVCSISQANW